MIVSHKHKFIFIKTRRVAGTSIEVALAKHLGDNDIYASDDVVISPQTKQKYNIPRNHKGLFNPLPDIRYYLRHPNSPWRNKWRMTARHLANKKKFWGHMPAWIVKQRLPKEVWNDYFKFAIERNPWDKTISHYHWINKAKFNNTLTFDEYMDMGWFCLNYDMYTDYRDDGRVIVDKIIKYEDLNSELMQTLNGLGVPFTGLNERYRKSNRLNYRSFFSGKNRKYIEQVADIFRKEIKLHGYEF